MARLTAKQVRTRAALVVILVALTFIQLVLGMVFAGESPWFYLLILVIDLPFIAIMLIVDWAERAST